MSQPAHSLIGKRVAVTGPGGFIGGAVCRAALAAGAHVIGLGPGNVLRHTQLHHVPDLIEDAGPLAEVIDGADLLVHAAGRGTPASVDRLDGAVAGEELRLAAIVLEAAQAAGVRRVVLVSSGGTVYGDTGGLALIDEAQPMRPSSRYGAVKAMIEHMALALTRAGLMQCVVARVSNPYGPGQVNRRSQGLVATLIEAALNAQPIPVWGDGSVVRDYIYIDDAARGLLAAAALASGTVCNVSSGVGRSVNAVIADVAAVLGRSADVVPMTWRDAGVARNVLSHALLSGCTGWRPEMEWRDGLQRTAAWWLHTEGQHALAAVQERAGD